MRKIYKHFCFDYQNMDIQLPLKTHLDALSAWWQRVFSIWKLLLSDDFKGQLLNFLAISSGIPLIMPWTTLSSERSIRVEQGKQKSGVVKVQSQNFCFLKTLIYNLSTPPCHGQSVNTAVTGNNKGHFWPHHSSREVVMCDRCVDSQYHPLSEIMPHGA